MAHQAHDDDDEGQGVEERALLAVDLGLRCGLALYDGRGQLRWYRSQHFGSRAQLKRAVYGVMRPIEGLSALALEGDRGLGELWARLARKWDVEVMYLGAETWRAELMLDRHQTSGQAAKARADELARLVIERGLAPNPTSLRHDAAEAILIGLWGVLELGWLEHADWLPGT